MQRAKESLMQAFPDITFTPAVTSPAYGMDNDAPHYTNMLATFHTNADEQHLTAQLKHLERELGDTPTLRSQGTVMMDLDLLQYHNHKRHPGDWKRPYIKELLHSL